MEKGKATSGTKFPRRRLEGLKKKLQELCTLCGVEGVLVCIPDSDSGSSPSEVERWPEDKEAFLSVVKRYKECEKRGKKMMEETPSTISVKEKADEVKTNLGKRKREKEAGQMDMELVNVSEASSDESGEMVTRIDPKQRAVDDRIRLLEMKKSPREEEPPAIVGSDEKWICCNSLSGFLGDVVCQSRFLFGASKNLQEGQGVPIR